MKRLFILLLILVMSISLTVCNTGQVKGTVISQNDESMAELDIMPQKLFEFANIVLKLLVIMSMKWYGSFLPLLALLLVSLIQTKKPPYTLFLIRMFQRKAVSWK